MPVPPKGRVRKRGKSWQADIQFDHKRKRRTFSTKARAQEWIDALLIEHQILDVPLTGSQLTDARRALDMAPPGVTLTDAMRFYASQHGQHEAPPLDVARDAFLAAKEGQNLRPRTLQSYSSRIGALVAAHPGASVADLSTAALSAWIHGLTGGAATRNNYRREVGVFLEWCVAQGYLAKNPMAGVPRSRQDEGEVTILTVPQAKALMAAAQTDPPMAAYLAVSLFAGLRAAELARLDAGDIGPEYISVGAAQAKTRQRRYTTIVPNLRAWLDWTSPKGALLPPGHRRRFRAVRLAAGIDPWPTNAGRHSFGSYHLALHGDSASTSHEMGHRNPDILWRHYRELVSREEAEAYFSIVPA